MAILEVLSGFLRPPDCLACGAADAWPCCSVCLPPEPAGPGPWSLAAEPTVTMWALGLYGDALRAAVLAGKLRGQAAALGALLLGAGIGADLVTWIAARPARGLPRDHARQVAAGVAGALDLPLVDLLVPMAGRDLGRARAGLGRPGRAGLGRRGRLRSVRPGSGGSGARPPASQGPAPARRRPRSGGGRRRHHRPDPGRRGLGAAPCWRPRCRGRRPRRLQRRLRPARRSALLRRAAGQARTALMAAATRPCRRAVKSLHASFAGQRGPTRTRAVVLSG